MKNIKNQKLIKTCSYINGQWLTTNTADKISVINPATNQRLIHLNDADKNSAEFAIKAAKTAFKTWSKKSANDRSELLRKWFDLIIENKDDLARLLTLEQGKPLHEAVGEINYGASFIAWFAEEAKRIYGDTIPATANDKRIIVIKQPVGVVAAITPWNFPNAMITRKAAAALAAGCTFVVRPATQTPLSALALAELASQAGIPAGVFNVIVSSDANGVGEILTTHPEVAKFTFTGSTLVGRKLIAQCASTVKKVSMELGGNAPFIVFDDADIDAAVSGAIASKYRNAGQTCVCTNRIFVQQSILSTFTEKYIAAVGELTVGNGLSNATDVGPMISSKAVIEVDNLVQQSLKAGAQLSLGGQPFKHDELAENNFYQPTVLTAVRNDMAIAQQEIFGPVSTIISFTDEAEAIAMANDTEYGLAAYFYARDIGRIWRVAESLEYGMVGINDGLISNAAAPFGGVKQSGYGREGSKYGLDDYLDIKYLSLGGLAWDGSDN
jgi:succinate-semialdehyde dehydrogenase/glutarate-semialdehyde dehydrogenase